MVLITIRTTLWVVPVADLGGVARHALDVARVGIPGWRLVFLCPAGPLADSLRGIGAAVLVTEFGPDHGLGASLTNLRHAVTRLRPQIVHTHLAWADIATALALRGLPVKLISTEHGIAPDDSAYHGAAWKSRVMAKVHHARILAFDRLIAVCQSTKDVMEAKWKPSRPIDVIHNGVDRVSRARQAPRETGLRVASIARLAREKGIDHLLRSFALVLEQDPSARLTIAGTGPLHAELLELSRQLGLTDHVAWPGHVEAAELLSRTDVLVQLSVWENCSYTLLDAVTAGVSVVATPVGGNREILDPKSLVGTTQPAVVAERIQDVTPTSLPDFWPTVTAMATMIASTYAGATAP